LDTCFFCAVALSLTVVSPFLLLPRKVSVRV
jgi:hypothetical protein